MKKVIAFSGSPSSNSINQNLIRAVVPLFDQVEVEVIDIRNYPMPFYSWDSEQENGPPKNAIILREKLNEADGYILSSPEYNGGMPAYFKNTIDWLSRLPLKIFDNKPVVLLSTSRGKNGGATNLEVLAKRVPWWGADLLGTHSVSSYNEIWADEERTELISKEKQNILKLVRSLEDKLMTNDRATE